MENNQKDLEQKQKNKQTSLMIIGLAILVIGLVGVTYAFFNYTRTGSANTIRVGKMAFSSNQTETINLTNVFPISRTDALTDTTNTDEAIITITGDTTYSQGIEYLVTVTDVLNTVNNKTVPISIIVGASNGLGTSDDNYFENRGSTTSLYKVSSNGTITNNGRILVGYIAPGATGINGTVTIKAYIDSSLIAISDTYNMEETDENGTTTNWVNGRAVLTTSEWNSLQTNGVSFKVKVEANEGIWVSDTLYDTMHNNAVMDNVNSTYVQNILITDNSNIRIQPLTSTIGDVKVRKLNNGPGIDFSQPSSDTNGKGLYMRAGTENDEYPIMYYRGNIDNNNVRFAGFCWLIVRTTETGGVKLLYNGEPRSNGSCLPSNGGASNISSQLDLSDNYVSFLNQKHTDYKVMNIEASGEVGGNASNEASDEASDEASEEITLTVEEQNRRRDEETTISNEGTRYFNPMSITNSLAGMGYMYGTVYITSSNNWTTNARFGSGFTWNGTSYTLVGDSVTEPDETHHYSCNVTTAGGTCNTIRYVYFKTPATKYYYIELTGGDGIEEAIEKTLRTENSSKVKTAIDSWYQNSMTNYTDKLEDEIWCDDKSFVDASTNVWNDDGSLSLKYMYYAAYDRVVNTHEPTLICSNKNDSFTVSNENGNKALTYPTGLLTIDEVMLAGRASLIDESANYLTGSEFWIASPGFFDSVYGSYSLTSSSYAYVNYTSPFIRPAIVIKNNSYLIDGDGSPSKPYVVQ